MKAILKTLALSTVALSMLVSHNAKAGTISIDNKTNQKIEVYANVIACGDGISFEVAPHSKKSRFTLCLLENVIINDKSFSKGVKFGANIVITEKTIAGKKTIDIQTKEESEAQATKEKQEAQKASQKAVNKILSSIQQIKNKTATAKNEKELNMLSADLEKLREEAFSFHVQNDNLLESYKANFASTSIAPDQAYAALQTIGIVTAKENPYTMQTGTIHTRIKNRIDAEVKKGRQSQDPLLKELRQIDYIFRNDVSRKKYDNWLKNAPQIEISRDTLDKLLTQLVDAQSTLLEKIEQVK